MPAPAPFMTIPLTQGREALVSPEDYERVAQYKWCAWFNTCSRRWYGVRTEWTDCKTRKLIYMHRFILGTPDGQDTDHIDRSNTLDNRRSNLRIATRSQNAANRGLSRSNRSGYRGVFWSRRANRWCAQIYKEGMQTYIGSFTNVQDAALAYDAKARELFGEFAFQNFPKPIAPVSVMSLVGEASSRTVEEVA